MRNIALHMKRLEVEHMQDWDKERGQIPFIEFPAGWKIKIIPPTGDAVVRFLVVLPSGKERSVYLDSRFSLGFYGRADGEPVTYWEVYPYQGDVGRCEVSNVATLLEMIADESEGDE